MRKANGESIRDLTTRTERAFLEDVGALGVLQPTRQPRVTEHIPEIVAMIETLIARANAYEAEGHVLFAVASDPGYGQLSGHSAEELLADQVTCGPDLDRHVEAINAYAQAGFDELYIQQVGPRQDEFFEVYAERVLPRVR